jgi:hypothetical protein
MNDQIKSDGSDERSDGPKLFFSDTGLRIAREVAKLPNNNNNNKQQQRRN